MCLKVEKHPEKSMLYTVRQTFGIRAFETHVDVVCETLKQHDFVWYEPRMFTNLP